MNSLSIVRLRVARCSFLLALLLSGLAQTQAQPLPPYKNAKLSTAVRVADLLKRMTLEEKAAQLYCHWESSAKAKFLPNEV